MTRKEIEEHNEKMIEGAYEAGARYLEWAGEIIVGYGSDRDYDTHALEVMNGDGYYDSDGRYHGYGFED